MIERTPSIDNILEGLSNLHYQEHINERNIYCNHMCIFGVYCVKDGGRWRKAKSQQEYEMFKSNDEKSQKIADFDKQMGGIKVGDYSVYGTTPSKVVNLNAHKRRKKLKDVIDALKRRR